MKMAELLFAIEQIYDDFPEAILLDLVKGCETYDAQLGWPTVQSEVVSALEDYMADYIAADLFALRNNGTKTQNAIMGAIEQYLDKQAKEQLGHVRGIARAAAQKIARSYA